MSSEGEQQFERQSSRAGRERGNGNPYDRFARTDLILRDHLAIDRTVLANERTFLSYSRTALALIVTGAGCIKFFEGLLATVTGWGLIALGIAVALVGAWRSAAMSRNINTVRGQAEDALFEGARPEPQESRPENRPRAETD